MGAPTRKLSLEHRYRSPLQPGSGPQPGVLMLHGYGSNEDDLIGLAPYLDPRFAIVSARAPLGLGMGAYAWFPIDFAEGGVRVDTTHVGEVIDQLIGFIGEAVAAYGIDPGQVTLLGFSQGAMMAGAALLRAPDLVASAALMSGFVLADEAAMPEQDSLRGKPILITHGLLDTVVPVMLGRRSGELLRSLGATVTYREYPMAHEISEACLEDVDAWLTAVARLE